MSGSFLTAKALSNRMKSRGLQRLRWYCQMCEKQCRDENGFKCHTRTEAHLRQMALFTQSSDSFVERFSQQFSSGYMAVLRRQGGRQVKANHVYTQYIADKEHVHMNATKWDTLSSFVSYLGKQRLADVEQDEHGDWLVRYIDRDPRLLERQQEVEKKASRERSREQEEAERIEAEMASAELIQRQQQQQTQQRGESVESDSTSEQHERRQAEDERRQREWLDGDRTAASSQGAGRLTISLARPSASASVSVGAAHQSSRGTAETTNAALWMAASTQRTDEEKERESIASDARSSAGKAGARKRSAVELVMEEEQQRKQRAMASRPPPQPLQSPSAPPSAHLAAPWLSVGLVVKVLNRSLHTGRYYGQKGRVEAVEDAGYTALVRPADSTLAPLRVDQKELQTVIPAIGYTVRIVAGKRRRGETATLSRLSDDQSTCTVECVSDGQRLDGMEFDNVCKIIVESPLQQ